MDWLNLHTSVLDSPEFLGAEPLDRATWLCFLRYCIGQENGGTVRDCSGWGDRRWQQFVRITKKEAARTCDLWAWIGDDVVVRFYPLEKEQTIQARREAGRIGGSSKSEAKGEASRRNGKQNPKREPSKEPTEGEGKGNRKGRESEPNQDRGDPEPDLESVLAPQDPKASKSRSPEQEWAYIAAESWFVELRKILDSKLAKSNWQAWKRLVDTYGIEAVLAAAGRLSPKERWPSEAEEMLMVLASHTKSAPAPVDPVLDRALSLIDRIGWEKARERLSNPEVIKSDALLRDAVYTNPDVAAELVQGRAS